MYHTVQTGCSRLFRQSVHNSAVGSWMSLQLLSLALLGAGSREVALEKQLQKIIDDFSAFWNVSASFAIHNESVQIAVAAGANDYSRPATSRLSPETRIPSGSATKLFTSVSVLRLVENGTLQLDDPVAPLVDRVICALCTPLARPHHGCRERSRTLCVDGGYSMSLHALRLPDPD